MEGFVGLALLIAAVIAIGALLVFINNNFWTILLLLAAGGATYAVIKSMIREKEEEAARIRRQQERIADEELKRKQAAERVDAMRKQIYRLHFAAQKALEHYPSLVADAEKHLTIASNLFSERAIYLFWDRLELAAEAVERCKRHLDRLRLMSVDYEQIALELREPTPSFPGLNSSQHLLREPKIIMDRIEKLFQIAHRDTDFISIYSTRKTNSILASGFANLSDAMRQISSDIGNIGRQLETGFRSLEASMERSWPKGVHDIVATVNSSNDKIAQMNRESLETEKKMLDTLDNIQRGRVPLPSISSGLKHATSTMPKKD